MAVRPIHLLGSPVLREVATPIETVDDEVRTLIADMYETMDIALGVGLAANQVGVARRVAVIDADGQRFAMINPRVVPSGDKVASQEGCLSIPEAYGDVTRPEKVTLEALDEQGQPFTLELDGLAARAVQHELDHLDGVLFVDHLSPLKRQLLVSRWKKDHKGQPLTRIPTAEDAEAER